jgi:hypothetical protein
LQLSEILDSKKGAILSNWRKRIIATYPEDSHRFLGGVKDRFSNPIGAAIRSGTEALLTGLQAGDNQIDLCAALEELIKIRSVQDFSASQAVAFVLLLKKAIRDEIGPDLKRGDDLKDQLLEFFGRVDALLLLAFDNYTDCREKIYSIRINELKNNSALAYRHLNRPVKQKNNNGEPDQNRLE